MPEKTEKWYSFEKEREGRLLHLRFPPKTDYRAIQPKLPRLVWVTYKPTEFPDPEPSFEAFHRSLMPLDDHIVSGLPCPVLIETFLRMRTYYSYAPEDFSFKELQEFTKATFPKEELIWESKLDPNWKLLRSYSQEIGFRDSQIQPIFGYAQVLRNFNPFQTMLKTTSSILHTTLFTIGLLLLVLCPANASKVENSRPNIVFILADDMGWNEVGFNGGNPEHTPHIDRLRSEGVSLTQFYSHAVCAPTRAAFLTGRYAFRTWSDWRSEDFGKPSYLKKLGLTLATNDQGEETRRIHALDTNERTIAEALRDTGYLTALIGKWHCGEWLPEHLPMGQGFTHQYGHYAWGIDYNNYTIPHNAPARYAVYDWHRDQEPLYEKGYTTDLIANETVRLIAQHGKREANKRKPQPFFFYVPFNAVHGPLEEIPRYTDKYEKRYAALKCLDDAVGRIVGAVDQYGFRENTLVVFANDNGGLRDEMNAPYRGTKNTNYEGGVRVPCVFRWPGKIEPGSSNDSMMHIVDLYSTFLSLSGANPKQKRQVDSINMTGTIFSKEPGPRDEIIYEVSGSVRFPAIRLGDYKLVGKELYNITVDPSETEDIAAQNPAIVARLAKRVAEAGAQRPPMPDMSQLMSPALPWVYGQKENATAPEWVKEEVRKIRATQPKEWEPGTTPWPQAPVDGKITYTGDGR